MSANDGPGRMRRLADFPIVFLSYDEPWADRNWLDLRANFPRVVRVHGVKGLDACHKAAAAAVPGDWVVTVDADTLLDPSLAHASVPEHLLTGDFRLDWLARNAVNGLWSGNGSVKLWPKGLIQEMRTHEAAPEGELSLDHDIAGIRRGRSVQVAMPERAATTNPGESAFHAFRSGLRETAFLRSLAQQAALRGGSDRWQGQTELMRLIEIWCSLGRQALNGRWMMYGARLGLVLPDLWSDWDPRLVNDHDALRVLWQERVVPEFQRGHARQPNEPGWNWPRLESTLRSLAQEIRRIGLPELAEFDAEKSRLLAGTPRLAAPVRPARMDALGYRLMTAARTPEALGAARNLLGQAAILDHPAAHLNLAGVLDRDARGGSARAAWHMDAAAALGNETARTRLAGRPTSVATAADLPRTEAGKPTSAKAAEMSLVLDRGVTLLPQAAHHVPDPSLISDGLGLSYLSCCPVTGRPVPRGVTLVLAGRAVPDHRKATARPIMPIVLGLLPEPKDAAEALRCGAEDGPGEDPLFATLGRDHALGDHWLLGALHARLGQALSAHELRHWAKAPAEVVARQIAELTRRLAECTATELPLWTPDESRALKRMIPSMPARGIWLACAATLADLGPDGQSEARLLEATATTIWGAEPAFS